jgi:hypothetical protein
MNFNPISSPPNELYCGGCKTMKFAGFFSDCQKLKPPGSRRCMSCYNQRSKALKRHRGEVTGAGKGSAWRGHGKDRLLLPNTLH